MAKAVWNSSITADMVKGWSDEKIEELIDELNDAVERIFSDIEGEMDDNEEEDDEEEED